MLNKYLTIEVHREDKKHPFKVGHLCADNVEDAYEQMGANVPRETPETLVVPVYYVNQLIIDLNKMVRRV